ncbi:hypothetical protein ACFPOI_51300 [Nonomuraea angiospora]|uniref:Secreted protein n=1 Tax=Nonomuraea angiospora TaxID=46172 RepID=A0ABR9M1F2_9ACTN|nr:hypothetical protein [Nonomuraea angiospora]MBE1586746.1 hypothetical protein [Nonomuraea angiospora]
MASTTEGADHCFLLSWPTLAVLAVLAVGRLQSANGGPQQGDMLAELDHHRLCLCQLVGAHVSPPADVGQPA